METKSVAIVNNEKGAKTYIKKYYEAATKRQGHFPRIGPDKYIEAWYVPIGANPPKISHPSAMDKRGIITMWCGKYYSGRYGRGSRYEEAMEKYQKMPDIVIGTPNEVWKYLINLD